MAILSLFDPSVDAQTPGVEFRSDALTAAASGGAVAFVTSSSAANRLAGRWVASGQAQHVPSIRLELLDGDQVVVAIQSAGGSGELTVPARRHLALVAGKAGEGGAADRGLMVRLAAIDDVEKRSSPGATANDPHTHTWKWRPPAAARPFDFGRTQIEAIQAAGSRCLIVDLSSPNILVDAANSRFRAGRARAAAGTLQFLVDGVDRTAKLLADSVQVSTGLDDRPTLNAVVAGHGDWRPRVGQTVRFGAAGGSAQFIGSIDTLSAVYRRPGPGTQTAFRRVDYALNCVGLRQILDRHIVNASFTDRNEAEIARELIVQAIPDGIAVVSDDVSQTRRFQRVAFAWIPMSAALDALAELSSSTWMLDVAGTLTFMPRGALVDAPAALAVDSTAGDSPYLEVAVEVSRREYRNDQAVHARSLLTARHREVFAGDGVQRTFSLAQPLSSQPSVWVGTVTGSGVLDSSSLKVQRVGISGVTPDADWYWNGGQTEVSQESGVGTEEVDGAAPSPPGEPLTATQRLVVEYRGRYSVTVSRRNAAAVRERQAVEGGSGVYSHYIPDYDTAQVLADASQYAAARVARHSTLPYTLEAVTRQAGLRPGQILRVRLPEHGIGVDGEWDQFLVESVGVSMVDSRRLNFTVRATSGEHLPGWQQFIRSIQRPASPPEADTSDVFTFARDASDELVAEDGFGGT